MAAEDWLKSNRSQGSSTRATILNMLVEVHYVNLHFNYSLGFIKRPIQFFSAFVNYEHKNLRAILSRDSNIEICKEYEYKLNLYFRGFILVIFFKIKVLITIKIKRE